MRERVSPVTESQSRNCFQSVRIFSNSTPQYRTLLPSGDTAAPSASKLRPVTCSTEPSAGLKTQPLMRVPLTTPMPSAQKGSSPYTV